MVLKGAKAREKQVSSGSRETKNSSGEASSEELSRGKLPESLRLVFEEGPNPNVLEEEEEEEERWNVVVSAETSISPFDPFHYIFFWVRLFQRSAAEGKREASHSSIASHSLI